MSDVIVAAAILYGAVFLVLLCVLVVLIITDPPGDFSTGFLAFWLVVFWPLSLTGAGLYFTSKAIWELYQKRDFIKRKLRATYWEYRAKREEDEPEIPIRKVPVIPKNDLQS